MFRAACRVFRRDMDAIREADYLVAVLDGGRLTRE